MDGNWFLIPSEDFTKRKTWAALEGHLFEATALHVFVCKRKGVALLKGPAVTKVDVPAGSEVTLEQQQALVVTETDSLEQQVQETTTEKIAASLGTKLTMEGGFTGIVPTGKAATELSGAISAEVTDQLQKQFKTAHSYQVQESQSIKVSTKLKLDGGNLAQESIYFYLNVRPVYWDVYVMEAESVTVQYKREYLVLPHARKFQQQTRQKLGVALFRVTLYEPVSQYSIAKGSHVPEVEDPYAVTIGPVPSDVPAPSRTPPDTLRKMALLAFPLPQEKEALPVKKIALRGPAKKSSPKRAPARKRAAKRAAARRR